MWEVYKFGGGTFITKNGFDLIIPLYKHYYYY